MVSRIVLAALASLILIAGDDVARAQAPAPNPAVEKHPSDLLANWINSRFEELWKQAGVEQKETIDDATFLRRAYLDLIGKIPSDRSHAKNPQRPAWEAEIMADCASRLCLR